MVKRRKEKQVVPVSTRSLMRWINRAFEREDGRDPSLHGQRRYLKATRGDRARQELGDYYILDDRMDYPFVPNVNIEKLGRELEVLKPYEKLVEE